MTPELRAEATSEGTASEWPSRIIVRRAQFYLRYLEAGRPARFVGEGGEWTDRELFREMMKLLLIEPDEEHS